MLRWWVFKLTSNVFYIILAFACDFVRYGTLEIKQSFKDGEINFSTSSTHGLMAADIMLKYCITLWIN